MCDTAFPEADLDYDNVDYDEYFSCFVRHADLYFTKEEYEKAVNDLSVAKVYDQDLIDGDQAAAVHVHVDPVAATQDPGGQQDSFTRRR